MGSKISRWVVTCAYFSGLVTTKDGKVQRSGTMARFQYYTGFSINLVEKYMATQFGYKPIHHIGEEDE